MHVNKAEQIVVWGVWGWLVGASAGLTIAGISGVGYGMLIALAGVIIGFVAGIVYGASIPAYKRIE